MASRTASTWQLTAAATSCRWHGSRSIAGNRSRKACEKKLDAEGVLMPGDAEAIRDDAGQEPPHLNVARSSPGPSTEKAAAGWPR